MKNLFKLSTFLLSAVALFTVSCAEEAVDAPTPSNPNAISFTESIAALTKASDTAFADGDEISVFAFDASDEFHAYQPYTYSGSQFISSNPITYTAEDPSLSFIAIYPVTSLDTDELEGEFIIKENQTGDNYTASDLMSATAELTSSNTPSLTFYHRLSKVIFDLTFVNVEASEVSATIEGVTSVSCDYSNDIYTSNDTDEVTTITMADNGTNSYKAIVAPKTYSANDTLATITVDGVEYKIVLGAEITFASGYQYTSSITIEEEEPTITITFNDVNGDIEDWGSEEGNDIDASVVGPDDGTTDGDETVGGTNGLYVGADIYMDGSDGDEYGFLDFETAIVYTSSQVAASADVANSIDLIFYFYASTSATSTGTFGTPSGLTGSKLANYSSFTSSTVINSKVGYCRGVDNSTGACDDLIAAYNNFNYSDASIATLRTEIEKYFEGTYGTAAVYPTAALAATKNVSSVGYSLSIDNTSAAYRYGIFYYPGDDDTPAAYCMIMITSGTTYDDDQVNAVTFDYIYGI